MVCSVAIITVNTIPLCSFVPRLLRPPFRLSSKGFFGFGGLSRDSKFILRRVAIAKGLRDVDELLTSLGKQGQDINIKEAFALLEKECGSNAVGDVAEILYYQPGKGYENCNRLLERYTETVQKADNPNRESVIARKLNLCCGYTDDELQSLNSSP